MVVRIIGFTLACFMISHESCAYTQDVQNPDEQLAMLNSEFSSEYQIFVASARAQDAKDEDQRKDQNWDSSRHPAIEYLPKYAELAIKEFDDPELGLKAESALINTALYIPRTTHAKKYVAASLDRIMAGHVKSPHLDKVLVSIINANQVIHDYSTQSKVASMDCLSVIESESPHREIRASAAFLRATMANSPVMPKPDKKLALELLKEVKTKYSGLPEAKSADRHIFELTNLEIGCVAPNFSAVDHNGVPFELSDYRGKVVLIDFWGFWCGPCRKLNPYEKQLTAKKAGEPFAQLGILSEQDVVLAKENLEKENIGWRHVIEPMNDTKIASFWNVTSWPTLYVLDKKGVIRWKAYGLPMPPEELESKIDLVIKELLQDE